MRLMTSCRHLALLAFFGLSLAVTPAWAQSKQQAKLVPVQPASGPANDMVDISADESLEWYKDTRLYVARGKAKVIRGDLTVDADLLTAHVRDAQQSPEAAPASPQSSGNIDLMTAEGNVQIQNGMQQVFGQKAVYDLDQKTIKVTGTNLKYVSGKDIVTAKESLEYYEDKAMAIATGRAMAQHEGSRIEANTLSAFFARSASGQTEMTELRAKGDVIIVTKEGAVSRGGRAVYDAKKDKAILMDQVRITQGDTQLAGDKAEVDFATGQSRLLNSGSGRVRALLPASGSKSDKKAGSP